MKKSAVETIAGIVGLVVILAVVFIVIGIKSNGGKTTEKKPTTNKPTTRITTDKPTSTKKTDPKPGYEYTITYNLDGGTNNPNNPTGFNEGDKVTLLEPTKTGYDFDGWYTNSSYSGQPVTEITISTDYVLYAKFDLHKYTITYNNVDGLNNPNPEFYTINDSLITLSDMERYSSIFKGWYTTSTFEEESKMETIDPSSLQDYILYAEFEIIKTDPIVNVQAKDLTYNASEQELLNVNITGGKIYYSLDNENFTEEMPKGTNAGSYVLYYKVVGDDYHFDLLDQTITVVIKKATYDMSNVEFNDLTVTYDGNAHSITITGELPTGVSVTYENNEGINADIYEAKAKFTCDTTNYNAINDMTATLTINKATYDMSGVEFNNKTVTYNGNAQSITITGTLPTGVTVSYENNEGNTVGAYDAVAKFTGDFENYNAISDMQATLTITKATYALDIEFIDLEVTYDGNIHSIAITGTLPTGVTVEYENNDKINVGTYTVTAKFTGDATNYELISDMTATLKINKATYDMSLVTFDSDTVTYDGESHSILIQGTLPTGVTVEYENNGQTTVGLYIITAKFSGDATNYELISDMTATLTISKNAYDMSGVEFVNKTVTYDGSSYSIEITGTLPDGVTISYENNGKTNAGTYTITAKFTGDAVNYDLIPNKTAVLTIEKATYDMSGITFVGDEVIYNGYTYSIAILGTLPTGVTVEYENNDKVNAGTYTVVAKFSGDATNYNEIDDMTATLKINKATYDMSLVEFNNKTVTYDGTSKSIIISGTLPTGITVEYTGNGKINFGEYTITAKFSGDYANYNEIADMTATLTIEKATYDLDIEFIGVEVTYDGNVHSIAITGDLPDGVTVEYENNDQTNAGTYVVTAKFSSNNPNYEPISDMTASIIINKATATYTLPTAKTNLIYNGSEQALVNAGSVSAGALEYSLDGENWSTTIPTAITPNTYSVSYRFVLNNNYEEIDGGVINVEIEKATIDMSGIELNDKTVTYNGNAQTITITGTLDSAVTVEYNGIGTNVGTYPITAIFTVDLDLYNPIAEMTATLSITPATMTNVTVTGYAAVRDYSAHNIVVSKTATTVDSCDTTWVYSTDQETWVDEITVTDPEDSGTFYFKVTAPNHNDYIGHFDVIVTEKNVTAIEITNLASLSKTYDGTSIETPEISTNSDSDEITITYSLDGTTFTEQRPINAGHYTIKVEVAETSTYAKGSIQKTFDISKATYDMSSVEFNDETITYDGESHSLAITGTLPIGVTVGYENNGKTNVGSYVVTASFIGDASNYELISDMTATLKINKATYDMSGITFSGDELTYDGLAHSLAITGTLPTGVTVEYENNGKINVGSYIVTASFSGDATNYELISDMTATLKINKATYDMSLVVFNDLTIPYDGLSHKLTISGTLPTGVSVTYSDTASYTAVGDYEYTASFSGDATNYELISDMTATLTIEKATIDTNVVVVEDLTVTYNGIAQSIIATNIPDHVSVEYTGNGKTNAGTYPVTVTFVYDTDCYLVTVASKSATLTIEKATIDTSEIVFNDLTVTYDGTNKSIIATNVPSGITVEYSGNGQKNADSYTVTATFVCENTNYKVTVESMTATLTIEKATIDMSGVTFASATYSYDGNIKSVAVDNLPTQITGVNYTNNNQTNAGTYTVTASFEYDTDNYNEVENMTTTLKINKVSYDTSVVVFEDLTTTYDGTAKSIYATNVPSGVIVTYTNNGKINADSYTVTASFSVADTTNYEVSVESMTATLLIEKATIDMSGVTFASATYTYDGNIKSVAVDNLPTQITGVNYTNNNQTNAGTYTVTASFVYDTDNYNEVENMTTTLKINKASIDTSVVVFNDSTVNYDGTAKSILATNFPTGVTANYTNNGKIDAGTYTVTATFVYDTDNYTVTVASKTATLKINKVNPPYTVPTNLKACVGSTLASVTLPTGFTWNDPTTTSVGAAGNNNFTVTYTPTDTTNYNIVDDIIVTVAVQEKYVITCENNQSNNYSATPQGPVVVVTLGGVTVTDTCTLTYARKLTSASTYTNGLPTNAGEYNIKINCSGEDGYDADEVIVIYKIKKIKLTVTSSTIALNYSSGSRTWASISDAIKPLITYSGLLSGDETTTTVIGMHNGKYKYGTVSGSYIAPTADTIFGSSYTNVIGSTYSVLISQSNENYELDEYTIVLKYKTALIGSTYYTIEDAISATGTITFAGNSSDTQTYVATTFSSLPTSLTGYSSTFTINSRTLIVPFNDTTNSKSEVVGTTSGNVYSALVVPSGITLNFTGTATLSVASQLGAVGGGRCTIASIRGVMVNNGTINIASGCKVFAYGYLKGLGTLNMASGSTLTDSMTSYDWPGGTAASNMYSTVFLTNSYSVHNTSCTVILNSGVTYKVYLMANISSSAKSADVTLIVPSSSSTTSYLFKPTTTSGKITKYCQGQSALCAINASNQTVQYKDIFEIEGTWVDGTVSATVYVTISTSTSKPTPIGLMDIKMKSGSSLTISKSDFLFFPGSSLTIEEGASVSVTNSAVDLIFASYSEINVLGGDRLFTSSSYSTDHNDAYLLCNGSFTCAGSFAGKIITTGENGSVSLNNKTTSTYTFMTSTKSPYYRTLTSVTKLNLYSDGVVNTNLATVSTGTYYSVKDSNNNYGFFTTSGTLTFNVNGGTGSYSPKQFTIGASGYTIQSSDFPTTNPTKAHYSFGGWYTDDSLTTLALGYTTFCGMELYAKWNVINYSISYVDVYDGNFDSGNKSTNTNPTTFNYETNQSLLDPTNGNYVFGGWYVDSACTNKINMLNGSQLVNYVSSNTLTLYSLWYNVGTDKYVITFVNSNEDIVCASSDTIIDDGFDWSSYTLPIMTGNDNNYNVTIYFGGWYNNDTLVTSISSSLFTYNETTGNYELELIANWIEKNGLAITVGTMGTITTVYYKPGYTFTVPSLEAMGITLGTNSMVLINWQLNDGNTYESGNTVALVTQTELIANIKTFVKFTINSNNYTTVTVTLTSGNGYLVTYNEETGVSSANAFTGTSKTNGDVFYVTTGSKFNAKYTAKSGSENNAASITGTTPTTALTTTDQTYTVNTSAVVITPAGQEESCVASGTMITMADGTQKLVDNIVLGDLVLTWNFFTGEYEAKPVIALEIMKNRLVNVITVVLENGQTIDIISYQSFFDYNTKKYFVIDNENFTSSIGKIIAIQSQDKLAYSKIIDVIIEEKVVDTYEIITAQNFNFIGNGILTVEPFIFNVNFFDINENDMYDINDISYCIETYGLFTYEEFAEYMTLDEFNAFNGQYFKIAIAKGLTSIKQIFDALEIYHTTYTD